jgi:L-glutamine-phosphate cytidylyltransferase
MMHNVIILAAGRGSRVKNLTNKYPKPLLKYLNCSILDYQLKILNFHKINKINVVVGYKSQYFKKYKLNLITNKKFQTTNMLYSLFKAKKYLKGNLIISYGDIIYSKKILNKIIKSKKDISIAIDNNWKNYWFKRFKDPLKDLETCKISNNKIIELGKKTINYNEIKGQYIGLIKLTSKGCKIFHKIYKKLKKKKIKNFYLTDFLQELINFNYVLTPVKFNDPWIEFDNYKDFKIKENKIRLSVILREIKN